MNNKHSGFFRCCMVALAAVQLLFTSCGYDVGVRRALRMSSENREALEAVLRHYKESGDKEAYEVACFLIREMPGHGAYTLDRLNRFQDAVDAMCPEMPNVMRRVFHQIPVTEGDPSDFKLEEDLTHISADCLIRVSLSEKKKFLESIQIRPIFANVCFLILY